MAEGDSSSSFSETNNDSVLSGLVCYSTEVSKDSDALSVASLSLPVEEIRPYLFEPERLTSSESEETLEIVDHPGIEWLGNTNWYVNKNFYKCH